MQPVIRGQEIDQLIIGNACNTVDIACNKGVVGGIYITDER